MAEFRILVCTAALAFFSLLLIAPVTYCEEYAKEDEKDKEFVVLVDDMEFEYEEDKTEERKKRNAIPIGSFGVWPQNIVPFEFSNVFTSSERRLIIQAMEHWEMYTCVRFRPRNSGDIYALRYVSGNSGECRSFIGRISSRNQPQPVTLGPGCVTLPVIIHEIGHALGFYHEHSRPDRDEYITVVRQNVLSGFESAFATVPPSRSNSFNFGYDYASIMHYSPTTFARRGTQAIFTNQPNILFGDAVELSPLDIAKANALYQCGPHDTHPPRSVVVPPEVPPTLPGGLTCGSVVDVTGPGSVQSPGFPGHRFNQDCAYVLRAPEGYIVTFRFPGLQLEQSTDCTKDYVQVFGGNSIAPNNLVSFNGYVGGRICGTDASRFFFSLSTRETTLYYHTDGNNRGTVRGLEISYDIEEVDECAPNGIGRNCHTCVNTVGSFECGCNEGFYLSKPASTCFDVNECAIEIDGKKGGCDHTCVNFAGSYECRCNSGFFLQTDGKSCARTPPAVAPTSLPPGTSLPRIQTSSTQPPATVPPTTVAPTTRPSTSSSGTLPADCGGGPSVLTASSGSIQTVGWPSVAYPLNVECTWDIVCPAGSKIEIEFEQNFRIAGAMPDCPRDSVRVFDCNGAIEKGPFCHLTRPQPFTTTCNAVKVVFDSNGARGSTRTGFSMNYACTASSVSTTTVRPTTPRPTTLRPTTLAPTTPPPTVSPNCGGGPSILRDSQQGSIESLGWSNNQPYPLNTKCDWRIECPNSQRVRLTFSDSFRVAGQMPDCPRDRVYIRDCNGAITYGPFCHLTAPEQRTSFCNAVNVQFETRNQRGITRTGFRLNYQCV